MFYDHIIMYCSCSHVFSLTVAAKARATSSNAPMGDKLALEQMRTKLLKDIECFQVDARTFLRHEVANVAATLGPDTSPLGAEWDGLDGTLGTPDSDEPGHPGEPPTTPPSFSLHNVHTIPPERLQIPLPSTLGPAKCSRYGLSTLVQAERSLRIGQMNDALHGVRVGLGYKSFLYRSSVRKANSQRKKLRSFDEVHVADAAVTNSARVYSAARDAFQQLFDVSVASEKAALDKHLALYRPLLKSDLRANTALIEQGVRGVSKLHLAWFWGMDVEGDSRDSPWMAESKSI